MEILKRVTIEISTICNSACIICPQNKITRDKIIDIDIAKRIITQDCLEFKDNIDFFEFHNYNEPFLTFDTWHELSLIVNKIYGEKKIGLVTNGSVMTTEMARKIYKLNLSHMYFSVDGFTIETYEKHRINLSRVQTYKNIEYFLDFMSKMQNLMGDAIRPYISMVVTEKNRHEIEDLKNYFADKYCSVSLQDCDGRGETEGKEAHINDISQEQHCDWALGQVYILTNLDVVPCCLDWDGIEVMGNLKNQTLKEVWEGKKYQDFREKQYNKRKNEIQLCRDCKSNLIDNYPRHK